MGELEGIKNAWGYAEGGNGAVSMAIARAAQSHGALLLTESVSTNSFLFVKVLCHIIHLASSTDSSEWS